MWRSAARSIGACLALLCFFAVSSADPSPPSRADVTSGVRVAQRLIDTIPSPWRLDGDVRMAGDDAPVAQGNFVQASYALNKASLDSVATFSRAGNAMQFDSSGYLTYGPNNLLTQSNTFSNAAWPKSNVTVASGVDDPLGGTNAWTVTATAGSDTAVLYNPTPLPANAIAGVTPLMQTFWVRRRTGSGTINWSALGVGVGNAMTVTGSWTQVSLVSPAVGGGTGYFGIRLSTNGDAVDIYAPALSIVTYETTPRTQDQVITTSAAYYGPRFDYTYNGSSWVPAGLLVEGAATNAWTFSGDSSNAAWIRTNVASSSPTIGAALTAPDGTNSAYPITFPAVSGAGTASVIRREHIGTAAVYTGSVYLKGAVGGETLYLSATSNTVTYQRLAITLTTSWQRFQLPATVTAAMWHWHIGTDRRDTGQAATPAQTIHVYGGQIEPGSSASSYTPTGASAVTRAAETVQLTGPALSTLQGASASLFIEYKTPTTSAAHAYAVSAAGGAAIDNWSSTQYNLANGSTNIFATVSSITNTINRLGVAYSGSGRSFVGNGGTVSTDANAANFTGAMYLGSNAAAANSIYGYIRSFAIYNQRLPDATLQAKSVVGASYAANDNGVRFAFANDNLPVHWRIAL